MPRGVYPRKKKAKSKLTQQLEDSIAVLSVEDTLRDRDKRHGNYVDMSMTAQTLMGVMFNSYKASLPAYMKQSLVMIATKLSRIVNGHAFEIDHWHDIAGYAQLVIENLPKKVEGK